MKFHFDLTETYISKDTILSSNRNCQQKREKRDYFLILLWYFSHVYENNF